MSAVPVSKLPPSAPSDGRKDLADLGPAGVVRPEEEISVLLAGGPPKLVAEVPTLCGGLGRHSIECTPISHSPDALERLSQGEFDAVVVFDDLTGRCVLRGIVEQELHVPVLRIVERAPTDRARARTKARLEGAYACLFGDELSPALMEAIVLAAVEAQRALDMTAGTQDAGFDEDTGLLSRAAFLRRLGAAIDHAESDPSYGYAVLYVDASRIVADGRLDPEQAEALLPQVARRVARLADGEPAAAFEPGGFALLLRGFEHGEELEVAERLRHELQASYVSGLDTLHLDLGFGLARGRGLDASAVAAVARAQRAVRVPKAPVLDAAAHSGVRQVTQASRPRDLDGELASALQHDQFALTYQPIVELESGRGVGFEALIRWKHPDGQERLPAEFIGAANDSNLIVPIGYWCVEAAMRQMAEWYEDFGLSSNIISINLSTPQVLDPLFVERVRSLLMTTGLVPTAVRFEIEAGTIAEHPDVARKLIHGLVGCGTRVWVEDYGLSECTVDHLRGLPLDGFKIDRRFVSRIDGTEMTSGRIRHIVTAARALGLRTLGEGIENPLQANVLRWLGCTLGQGHLFAKPLPVGDAFAYLAQSDG